MTINEANAAVLKQSGQYKEKSAFSKVFRSNELTNIKEGETFEIPSDYKVIEQRIMRGGAPVTNAAGEPVTAEFINVLTNTGRNVRFYPSSVTKVCFAVDDNGKDLIGSDRIVYGSGKLYEYCKGKDINAVMQSLKGCTVKCVSLKKVNTRAFGVTNADATSKDIVVQNVGEWDLVGDKLPQGWA